MKRVLLPAVLLALSGLALSRARADEGAYGSLVGMARSAAQDAGPGSEAEGVPAHDAAMKDAVAQPPAPRHAAPTVPAAAPAPRLWTRLYSSLLPSWRRAPALKSEFEPALSTASARAFRPAEATLKDFSAVKAGERRGLAELMSAYAAPADLQ